jgi:hypothetical protein
MSFSSRLGDHWNVMTAGSRRALLVAVEIFDADSDIKKLQAARRDVGALRSLLGSREVGEFDLEPPCVNERDYELRHRRQDFFATARRRSHRDGVSGGHAIPVGGNAPGIASTGITRSTCR